MVLATYIRQRGQRRDEGGDAHDAIEYGGNNSEEKQGVQRSRHGLCDATSQFCGVMKKKEGICSLFSEATAKCNAVLKNEAKP